MKSRESKLILIIVILVILLIGMSINLILNPKGILTRTKQIVKEMTVSEYDNQITELNESHTDYARQVQENKKKLAQAISNENVPTSEDATVDEMVTNIGEILEARTSDATATADNITEGKTAYVNGTLVIGNGVDNKTYQENAKSWDNSVFYGYYWYNAVYDYKYPSVSYYDENSISVNTTESPYNITILNPGTYSIFFTTKTWGAAGYGKLYINGTKIFTGPGSTTETITVSDTTTVAVSPDCSQLSYTFLRITKEN